MTPDPSTGTAAGTHPASPAAPAGWEPGRRFTLRVAGLPAASVDALRCAGAREWADQVLAAEEALRSRAETLSDLLHEAVGATDVAPDGAGAAQRRALLALRRQIFNNRLPSDPAAAERLVADLAPGAAAEVTGWVRDRRRLAELLDEGASLLATDQAATRAALRALLTEERLRCGLLLASPTLEGQLDGYLATAGAAAREGRAPDKRTRKIERSVLSYLYRTACKTSPFSTFTAVADGHFREAAAPGPADATVRVDGRWSSHVRLNVVVLGRFAELILADPARRHDLPVRLASGWERDDDRIRYVRQWVTTGDDSATVTFDAVRDRLFFLRRSGTLDQLLGLFEKDAEPRYRDLVGWLRDEHDATPEQCEAYVAALLQLGMVRVPCLDTDVHSGDPLRAFQTALRDLARPWAERLADALDGPARILADFPRATSAERAALTRALRAELRAAQELLGAEDPTLPQTLLYEDVSAGQGLGCERRVWTGLSGGDLRDVERVLPAFDLTLPQRVTFRGFFVARYGSGGRCDDLLGLVHDFHEDFFDQYLSFTGDRKPFDDRGEYVPEENWLGLPGIRALDSARRTFVSRMRRAWAERGDAEEIHLDPGDLTAVADELAPVAGDFAPQSHHVQLAAGGGRDGAPLVVLNRSYGGLSFPFSRFTHVYDQPAPEEQREPVGRAGEYSAALRATAERITPEGAVLAEITGGAVTSNLNLHSPLTEYEIVCPGESSTVPEDRRIHLDDLYVEHDAEADRLRLRSARLDREVIPVYLGYLVPLALPEIPRTLLLMSPTSMAPLEVWGGVPEGPETDGVTSRPRVRYGDLVLSRRSWTTTAGALPTRGPGVPDHDWFLGWQRWRRAHRLPAQVFATVSSGPRGAVGAKPQFVDFDSYLSLSALEALLTGPGDRVVLREQLPGRDGLHVRSERGEHVAELAVETFTSPALAGPPAPTAPDTPHRPTEAAPTCQS
ncbi:lantibiotic dehydratase [Streptomyces sp. AJS327]|uniref:lantibiotic dehydratase n=1 Tax=Streptomyces sp. AJS327 TaxID=2545265 RepID=UPI0015DFA51E|nr:lantibiotic dehydratase [Streptomyces sp. AJS327]MBA0052454.1 lantibiotic dehydratase [Streptomyces sp. AJS327]